MTMCYYYCNYRHISLLLLLQCMITTATTDTFYRAVTIYKSTLWQCGITTAMTMYYDYCNYRHLSLLVPLQCIFTTVLSLVQLQCIITTAITMYYYYCNYWHISWNSTLLQCIFTSGGWPEETSENWLLLQCIITTATTDIYHY